MGGKTKAKAVKETKEPKNVKHVEHIREEVKYIKRYVGLHNKVKSPNTILAFIKALQRSNYTSLILGIKKDTIKEGLYNLTY